MKFKHFVILFFLVLFYFMFFYDNRKKGISEIDFNKSVINKTISNIYNTFGEPDYFEIRENFIIIDYDNFVINPNLIKKETRYSKVRLIFRNLKDSPLSPKAIYFVK